MNVASGFPSTHLPRAVSEQVWKEFDTETSDEKLLCVVTSELFIRCIEIKGFLMECSHLSLWLLFFLVSCVF